MLKATKSDLHRKSNAQLSALFLKVSCEIQSEPLGSPDRKSGLSLLAMIANEQASRRYQP